MLNASESAHFTDVLRHMTPAHLQLVPVTMQHKHALGRGRSQLAALLEARVPEGWPQFPEAFEILEAESEAATLWPAYLFISPSEGALVGNGGFAAAPNASGEVEIGYEIASEFRNRGYATAAVRSMAGIAFSREDVTALVAHTLALENASCAVLRNIGMSMTAELPNPEVGKVWKWSIDRATWLARPDL